jgi:hypothetical protein
LLAGCHQLHWLFANKERFVFITLEIQKKLQVPMGITQIYTIGLEGSPLVTLLGTHTILIQKDHIWTWDFE